LLTADRNINQSRSKSGKKMTTGKLEILKNRFEKASDEFREGGGGAWVLPYDVFQT
jgi:hypothetical protein